MCNFESGSWGNRGFWRLQLPRAGSLGLEAGVRGTPVSRVGDKTCRFRRAAGSEKKGWEVWVSTVRVGGSSVTHARTVLHSPN